MPVFRSLIYTSVKPRNRVLMDSQVDLGYDKSCFIIAVLNMNSSALSINYGVGTHDVLACAGAGIGFGCALWSFAPPLAAVAGGYLAFAMLLIAVIDARRFIIPDFLSLPLVPIGIAVSAGLAPQNMEYVVFERIGAAAVAGIALYAVRWIYQRLRKIEGLGLGDVKLAAAAGAWVGFGSLGMTLLLATCAALASTLYRQYLNDPPSIGLQTRVPFGSFIAPSTIMMWSVVLWYSQAGWLQAL